MTNKHRKQATLPERYAKGFLDRLDGRTEIARELHATYDEITGDLGGSDNLSAIQRVLVEKFCWLSAILRGVETQIADGDKQQAGELLGRWIQGLNSLTGLAKTLGLKRQAKRVDLKSYVEGKCK